MILTEYIEKLQKLEEQGHGDKELIYARDPDGTLYYWVTEDPELCIKGKGLELKTVEHPTKEEFNCICIN